jgi:hypothetical protein
LPQTVYLYQAVLAIQQQLAMVEQELFMLQPQVQMAATQHFLVLQLQSAVAEELTALLDRMVVLVVHLHRIKALDLVRLGKETMVVLQHQMHQTTQVVVVVELVQ